jgi:hypothetical protein
MIIMQVSGWEGFASDRGEKGGGWRKQMDRRSVSACVTIELEWKLGFFRGQREWQENGFENRVNQGSSECREKDEGWGAYRMGRGGGGEGEDGGMFGWTYVERKKALFFLFFGTNETILGIPFRTKERKRMQKEILKTRGKGR